MNANMQDDFNHVKNIHNAITDVARNKTVLMVKDRHVGLESDILVAVHDRYAADGLKATFQNTVLPKPGGSKSLQTRLQDLAALRESDLYVVICPELKGKFSSAWDLLDKVAQGDMNFDVYSALAGFFCLYKSLFLQVY